MTPEICPHCGSAVPARAKACPACGSDEHTGWSEPARYDRLDLPSQEFDYGEFLEREFPSTTIKPLGINWFWWVVGLVVLLVFAGLVMRFY